MEEQSLEETGPDLKSEDLNAEQAADVVDSDELAKSDVESCAVEVEEETEQAATEEDGLRNMQNAPENPEEEFEASVRADLQHNLQLDSQEEQELLRELQTENEKLRRLNYQFQTKLAEYFWLKSAGEMQSVQEKIYPKQECSQKYPDIIEDIRRQRQDKKQKHLQHHHVDELLRQNNEKLEQIELEWSMLTSSKREVLITDLEQANGKIEAQAVAERLLTAAQKCEDDFVSVRHENFKLNLKMSNLEPGLHVRDNDLDGEMHHIDFEQLNIENQTYGEKIQECTEDLLKLKRTFPQPGQILMHVKEKLTFVQVGNQEKHAHFDELDALVLQEQEVLTQTMQTRDILRFDNLRKRKNCGLLGNPTLLRNLEDTENEREALERQVEMLKRS
ncbi:hypothetical protein QTP86_030294 [Hemibagrus guttatus]|nr:hypothetical protein QTP86_030294 [Hemibagrus guttatus]